MPRISAARTASLIISLLGAIFNFTFAVQVLALWRNIKWEPESEWEGAADSWRVDGVKLVWGLLSAYFAAAATACLVGFYGIIKNIPSFVRFYRDYSIADFSFCTFFTAAGTYAAFRTSVRASVCEELSRQPELMRYMVEMGLNLENCELWFERAVLAWMGVMVVLIVVRLHFLMAVSKYYSHLSRYARPSLPFTTGPSDLQRIYLLPRNTPSTPPSEDPLVYSPVPLSSLSPSLRSSATEAWISRSEQSHRHAHGHRHHGSATGAIRLPMTSGEGLLPDRSEVKV
jgi:hypothetical protein